MRYRIEKDAIGEMQIPAEAYYGIQTLRSSQNFSITKRGICRQLIKSLSWKGLKISRFVSIILLFIWNSAFIVYLTSITIINYIRV